MAEAFRNFMLWDGVAILAFGGILLLGIHLWNVRPFIAIACGIPLASILKWVWTREPLLTPISYIVMALMLFFVLVPRFYSSNTS